MPGCLRPLSLLTLLPLCSKLLRLCQVDIYITILSGRVPAPKLSQTAAMILQTIRRLAFLRGFPPGSSSHDGPDRRRHRAGVGLGRWPSPECEHDCGARVRSVLITVVPLRLALTTLFAAAVHAQRSGVIRRVSAGAQIRASATTGPVRRISLDKMSH